MELWLPIPENDTSHICSEQYLFSSLKPVRRVAHANKSELVRKHTLRKRSNQTCTNTPYMCKHIIRKHAIRKHTIRKRAYARALTYLLQRCTHACAFYTYHANTVLSKRTG